MREVDFTVNIILDAFTENIQLTSNGLGSK